MRPIQLGPYSPITADTSHFNAAATSTGAAIVPTTTATSDGLAHLVTLTSAAANDLSALSFALVGTDANGADLTETIAAGPNNSTVSSTKHFKTLTSVTPSATMATKQMTIGIGAESVSPMIPLEWRSIAAAAMTVKVSGTINFTVEETYANPYSNAHESCPWVSVTALAAKTATTSSTVTIGSQAVHLKTNTVTNGATLTWYITQASCKGV